MGKRKVRNESIDPGSGFAGGEPEWWSLLALRREMSIDFKDDELVISEVRKDCYTDMAREGTTGDQYFDHLLDRAFVFSSNCLVSFFPVVDSMQYSR